MKNKSLIIMFLAAVMASGWTGCSTLRFNNSDTLKYLFPKVYPSVLVLKKDHTFIMRTIDGDEKYRGEWRQDQDTLIMLSDEYRPPYESLDTLMKEAVNICFTGSIPVTNFVVLYCADLFFENRPLYDKLMDWSCMVEANDGYRDIYLIRGRHLYDGVYKTRAGYVRIKPKKRQADSNQVIE